MRLHWPRRQFSLRTIFVLITLTAVLLAWRWRVVSEAEAIAAIRAAGGQVYFNYQSPTESTFSISVAMPADQLFFSQVKVQVNAATRPKPPTLLERIAGSNNDDRVSVVTVGLDQVTPKLIPQIQSLRHLRRIVLQMPAGSAQLGSPEIQRFETLQQDFAGIIIPSHIPPLP